MYVYETSLSIQIIGFQYQYDPNLKDTDKGISDHHIN